MKKVLQKVTPTLPSVTGKGGLEGGKKAVETRGPGIVADEAGMKAGSEFKTTKVAPKIATPTNPIARQISFEYDLPPGVSIETVKVKGSWDQSGAFSNSWDQSHVQMTETPKGSGHWVSPPITIKDDGLRHAWKWGVDVQYTKNAPEKWGMKETHAMGFSVSQPRVRHAPTTYHLNGARKQGDALTFRAWFPKVAEVMVKIVDGATEQRIPMERDPHGQGWWRASVEGGFEKYEGKPYSYVIRQTDGRVFERIDMNAVESQGEQRGLRRFHVSTVDGQAANEYWHGDDPKKLKELLWFNVDDDFAEGVDKVFVVLKDEHGQPVSREALQKRLGEFDCGLIDKARKGAFNDFWDKPGSGSADTRFEMTKVDDAFTLLMQNPKALSGLRYEFQTADGKLVGDVNKDGKLDRTEKMVGANDPWDNRISDHSGKDYRKPLIKDLGKPEPLRERTPSSVVYQLHPASYMSTAQNVNRATWEDVIKQLDYLKDLGITDIQTLPPAEVEGTSWGYEGISVLGSEQTLGFVERTESGEKRWVSGDEAYKRFVSAAHERGLNVIVDVVLNHLHDNLGNLWDHTGSGENPYFNRNTRHKPGDEPHYFDTPWGKAPALNKTDVRNFLMDYVMRMRLHHGVDGVRFDFTKPIVDAGGTEMLQQLNSMLEAFGVGTRIAEHFDYEEWVTRDVGAGGLGFTHQLYVKPNHEVVDHDRDMSVLGKAGQGKAKHTEINMDGFMGLLTTQPRGFLRGFQDAVVGWTTHDEVGNGARATLIASGYDAGGAEKPGQFARNGARLLAGIGAMSPGKFMMFQGEESLAGNAFKWGIPSTWASDDPHWMKLGKDWNWDNVCFSDTRQALYVNLFKLSKPDLEKNGDYRGLNADDKKVFDTLYALEPKERAEQMKGISRRQAANWVRDAVALRKGALGDGGTQAERIYTHNADAVMAFRRPSNSGDLIVVANLSHEHRSQYNVHLPPGKWKEVLNSDAARYGGDNFGNAGATLDGGSGMNIPKGGVVVLQRVG